MNPFFTSLFSTNSDLSISLSTPELKLIAGTDTNSGTLYFFRPYKSSDFPEITTTKDWFWIWSTDHDFLNADPGQDGGIWWGESDDLELNGFVDRGLVTTYGQGTNWEVETPWLVRIPTEKSGLPAGEVIFLYFHTSRSAEGNDGEQQTRLFTSTGGTLGANTWNDRGRPITERPGERTHTGYLKIIGTDSNGDYVASHRMRDDATTPGMSDTSTSSTGLTFAYLDTPIMTGNPANTVHFHNSGVFFDYKGQRYGICYVKDLDPEFEHGANDENQRLLLASFDDDFGNPVFIEYLQDRVIRDFQAYIEGDTIYIYFTGSVNGDGNTAQLDKYLYLTKARVNGIQKTIT